MSKEYKHPDLILLNAGSSIHNGDWNWKEINSPFARLLYVRDGNAGIRMEDKTHNLKPDYMYFIPPFTLHGYECDSFFSQYYIHIYEKHLFDFSLLEEFNFPVEIKAGAMDLPLVERLLLINPGRELKQYDPHVYDNPPTLIRNIAENAQQSVFHTMETKGILFQLLSRFMEQATPKTEVNDTRILKVLSFIRKNIEKPISIYQLAEICHLCEDHFIRLFRKEMQCTPIRYINQKRIEKAQLMLIVKDEPIKDIAYKLSFENISYFSRLFKTITGYTPQQYRELRIEN